MLKSFVGIMVAAFGLIFLILPPRIALARSEGLGTHAMPVEFPIAPRRLVRKVPSLWENRWNVDWLSGIYVRSASNSSYNPDNTIFQVEDRGARTELNIDYRLSYNSLHKFVLRPRAIFRSTHTPFSKSEFTESFLEAEFTEAFLESWLLDQVSVTIGLHNFQWGPAELISPSNPFYHFNRDQRSILWKEKGHVLVRANWSPNRSWSLILISEPISNREPTFIAEKEFRSKAMAKLEFRSSAEAQNYIGLTGGTEEEGRSFLGTYFNYALKGLSVYSDFRYTQNSFTYFPKAEGFLANMEVDDRFAPSAWYPLGVYGIRFEQGSWDLRLEMVVNPRGYNKTDLEQALFSAGPLNPRATSNAARLSRPGLELLAKNYSYLSLRIPDLGANKQCQVSFRYLLSGMDNSGVLSSLVDWTLNDHLVAEVEGRQSFGANDSEFTLQEKSYMFLGLKALW